MHSTSVTPFSGPPNRSAVTYREALDSPLVAERLPLLLEVIADIAKRATPNVVFDTGTAFDIQLNARHAKWGNYLAAQGYIALLLVSFSSRGVKEICTTKFSDRTLKEADRVGDAYAALAYLRQLPNVDPSRIALLGWSHGGGVTLATISHRPTPPSHAAALSTVGAGFNAAIAFYPGCTARNKNADRFHPYAPLLLVIGETDDWTPAAPCIELATTVAARGEPMHIVTYPDTYHDFDNPALTAKRVRKDVHNGVNPGMGVTTAPNPEAREDAKLRVRAFLAENLK